MKINVNAMLLSLVALLLPALSSALELQGERAQGSLLLGLAEPGSQVWLNGEPVRLTENGAFVIGFGRDAGAHQTLRMVGPDGVARIHDLAIAQRDYRIQRIDGVPARTVTPSAQSLERIRREAGQVRQVRRTDSDLTGFLAGFVWPAEGRISGVYGSQRIYNGEPRSPHYGIDIAAPAGAPVIAPARGVVTMAEPDLFYSGGTLIIDHGYGVSSTFLHLESFEVALGEFVEQGDLVARVGSSGRSTGPHLDWRINWFEERIDPTFVAPPIESGRTPPLAYPRQ